MQTAGAYLVRKMNSSITCLLLAVVLVANTVSGNHREDASVFEQRKENGTDECTQRLNGLRFDKTDVTSQALDSFGKPAAGLLVKNTEWLGHFSECSQLEGFKYCLLTINVTATADVTRNEQTYLIKWGVCVPRLCAREDVINSIPSLLDISRDRLHGFDVNRIYEDIWCLEDPIIPYGLGFYITIIFFIFIGILMVAGSILDVIERNSKTGDQEPDQSVEEAPLLEDINDESVVNSLEDFGYSIEWVFKRIASTTRLILLDFALNRNLKKLLQVGAGDNQLELYEWKDNFLFQTLIQNFYFAVDSFFFLSGFLVCFTTLRKLEAVEGRFPWNWFYLHRYVRLSPVLLVTIMINLFISPHFVKGPKAQMVLRSNTCANYWWTNLIYINNFYPWNLPQTCMPWTWYLATDMQLFVISPLIIISFKSFYWLGFGIIGMALVSSFVITGTLVAVFNFRSPIWELLKNGSGYVNVIYTKPYVHLSPYLVGMALGYILFKQQDRRITIPKLYLMAGWLMASIVAAAVLCGTNTFTSSADNRNNETGASTLRNSGFTADHHASALGSVMYEMFSRLAWGTFLCWVVIACQFGGPGWINDCLSWSFWEPLSRINYSAYLLHPILLYVFYGNFGLSLYASRVLMTYYFCGAVLLSYICALVLTLAMEIPVSNIERRCIPSVS